jgi:uncharacterized protein YxeA
MRRKKSIIIVLLCVIVVIGACVAVIYFLNQEHDSSGQNTEESATVIKTTNNIESDSDNLTPAQLNARYDEKAFDIAKEIAASDPAKWTKDDLNKVYFLITYYDKIGNNVSVYGLLTRLDTAQSAGVNIDNNSFDRNDSYRKEVRDRVIQDDQVKRIMSETK